jgi:hypothetical protein
MYNRKHGNGSQHPEPKTGEEEEQDLLHVEFIDGWENLLDSPSIAEYEKRKRAWEQRGHLVRYRIVRRLAPLEREINYMLG